jgi:hypothetical protein
MTDFRDLPIDIQRELAYNALSLTNACTALSKLSPTGESPEVWAQIACENAYRDISVMSDTEVRSVIEAIEQHRKGYGVARVEIKPKGFGK